MSVMGVMLRRYLTPIRDLFQWLHLVSVTVLTLANKGILPTLGCSNCLQE